MILVTDMQQIIEDKKYGKPVDFKDQSNLWKLY